MIRSNLSLTINHFIRARWRWHHLRDETLRRYQDQRAHQIIAYARQRAPFYAAHWSGYDLQQWRTLPTVNKQEMMNHFDTFNTQGIAREHAMEVALQAEQSRDFRPLLDGLTIGLSSGTSGHRGLFLVSSEEQAAWAGTILARTLHQMKLRRLRVAFFLRSNSNLYEEIGKGLIQFRYFDLMTPLAEAVQQLNVFQAHIVIGPPSLLGFLADEQRSRRLRIRPERLIAVAEVLEPHDQTKLCATFQAPVHQIYQCTEGFLAASCARGSLHVQEDLVALQFEELPGSNGKRVTPIVTDLWRTTQPIIRYRLNDILQLGSTPCPCGSPFQVIHAIEGRNDDVCYFESQAGENRIFYPDTLRRMILLASPEIQDYLVTQERCGQLHIALAILPSANFTIVAQAVQTSVAATLARYNCRPAHFQIEEGLPPPQPGIKRRRVQRRTTL
jgi:putative adenylate-forming enzyme